MKKNKKTIAFFYSILQSWHWRQIKLFCLTSLGSIGILEMDFEEILEAVFYVILTPALCDNAVVMILDPRPHSYIHL